MFSKEKEMTSCSQVQENGSNEEKQSMCDFCGDSVAVLYCKADSAKLCFKCDRKVHSTNQLFTKHTRSVLCDACESSPSSIFCSTHCSVFCQNCDWESHRIPESSVHDRRPLEGFNGCPSVPELLANFGFDDLGKKKSKKSDGIQESENFGFSDYLVWETPSVISLDDLISLDGSEHNFQATGFPPLPKNRNTVCGQRKEEMLSQLREMAKLEPGIDQNKQDLEPSPCLQSLLLYDDCQQQNSNFESKTEPTFFPSHEESTFQWCNDIGEDAEEGLPNASFQSYFDTDCQFLIRIQILILSYITETTRMRHHHHRILSLLMPQKSSPKLLRMNFAASIETLQSRGTKRRENQEGMKSTSGMNPERFVQKVELESRAALLR